MSEEFEVGEQHLYHAGAIDEVGDVGLSDGAPDRPELPPDRQILKAQAEPYGFHLVLLHWLFVAVSGGSQTEEANHRFEIAIVVQQQVATLDAEGANDKIDRLADRAAPAAEEAGGRRRFDRPVRAGP